MIYLLAVLNAVYVVALCIVLHRGFKALERLSILASERTPSEQARLLAAVNAPRPPAAGAGADGEDEPRRRVSQIGV